MKKLIALMLLVASPASSQTASSGTVTGTSGNFITIAPSIKTCSVTYRAGQLTTSNCDFASPLTNPRFSPGDRDALKIEFDQQSR